MIRLTDTDGNDVYVVAEHVFALEQARSDSTMVLSHGGYALHVRESIDDVAGKIAFLRGDLISEEWLDDSPRGI